MSPIQSVSLMDRWRNQPHHQGRPFISDGIIDNKKWVSAKRKVLILLKEAYDNSENPQGFDLCQLIREDWRGARYKIWWLIAKWCYGIQQFEGRIPDLSAAEFTDERTSDALLHAAVVNIKKSGGKKSSSDDEIKDFAKKDGLFIYEQIEKINPEIMICGNTWSSVKHLWPEPSRVYDLVYYTGGRHIVDFWHPSNKWPNILNYYSVMSMLQHSGALD